jgi:hypothetical protein
MSHLSKLFLWFNFHKPNISDFGSIFPRNCLCSVFLNFWKIFQTSAFSDNSYERHEIFYHFGYLHSGGLFSYSLHLIINWKWRGNIVKIFDFQIHIWNFIRGLWWLFKIARNQHVGELHKIYLFCIVYIFLIDNLHEPFNCNNQLDIFGTAGKNI